jgi:hypothetical protein
VALDAHAEIGKLLLIGKLAVVEEISHLDERTLCRQLLDGIAAIQQDALIAIDVGDTAFGTGRRHETRIESENTVVFVESANVYDVRADGPGAHRQGARFARGEIFKFEVLGSHGVKIVVLKLVAETRRIATKLTRRTLIIKAPRMIFLFARGHSTTL